MGFSSIAASPPLPVAVAATNDSAFEAAFDRCAASLHRYFAVRTGGDGHLADDFMQQLWLRARTAALQPPPPETEFWLRAIARNLLHAWWRKTARDPRHVPIADPTLAAALANELVQDDLPPAALVRREVRDQLLLALTELAVEHQELIVEHYFRGLEHAELATQYGVSARAIEGRLYRARTALREKLKHLEQ